MMAMANKWLTTAGLARLEAVGLERLLELSQAPGLALAIETPDGRRHGGAGADNPAFRVILRNAAGLAALLSLQELPVSEAYVRGDLDVDGDLVHAMRLLRTGFSDTNLPLKLWRRLQPLLLGRARLNPQWIAKHYDSRNVQLHALDQRWFTYTPGLYDGDDDSLESGAERKLAFACDELHLTAGQSLLEVGCGWGGMTRFAARRGARVTGITLSRDQLAFTQQRIGDERLDARALYHDFFSFSPGERFGAISMMGVIEDLSDYPRVMGRLAELLRPGGRVYLDFAAATRPFATASFVTKYVWPGTFRMVYMPEFVSAIAHSPFEIHGIYNDRRNYHLWAKKGHERWLERRDAVVAEASPETWRLFRLLFAGTSAVMDSPDHEVTAFRVVLELPRDRGPRTTLSLGRGLDAVVSGVKQARNILAD